LVDGSGESARPPSLGIRASPAYLPPRPVSSPCRQAFHPCDWLVLAMEAYLAEYMPILIFLAIAIGLAAIIIVASLVVAPQRPDSEKLSPYECGFEPFEDSRGRFDVRFYLVAILFIIFDLEVAFLFPWAVSLGNIGLFGFWSMIVFLAVLTVGFVYEWRKGALEWE
jgi:NADH-quinone oxidoreductase subunit A